MNLRLMKNKTVRIKSLPIFSLTPRVLFRFFSATPYTQRSAFCYLLFILMLSSRFITIQLLFFFFSLLGVLALEYLLKKKMFTLEWFTFQCCCEHLYLKLKKSQKTCFVLKTNVFTLDLIDACKTVVCPLNFFF